MKGCVRALFASGLLFLCAGVVFVPQQAAASKVVPSATYAGARQINSLVGQPYSATIESKNVQTLADGTHITRQGIARKEYRDSQGRTRTEFYMLNGSGSANEGTVMFVTIHDPTKGVSYLLNPRNHTAQELIPHPFVPSPVSPAASSPKPAVVQDLGMRTIEGFVVQGKRTTRVIPVGAQGNDQPIKIVTERWFSNELGINLLVINSDPRQGESTMRATNIDLSEPDPALFQIPANYTMQSPRSTF